MAEPWTFAGEPTSVRGGGHAVTLIEGSSFCLSDRAGDITGGAEGLFLLDRRILSRFQLLVDGQPLEPLGVAIDDPFAGVLFSRSRPVGDELDRAVTVLRRRAVGRGLRDELEITSYLTAPRQVRVELLADVDFASLFDVKEGREPTDTDVRTTRGPTVSRFHSASGGAARREVTLTTSEPAEVQGDRLVWTVPLPPGGRWSVCVELAMAIDGQEVGPRPWCGEHSSRSRPVEQLREWRDRVPVVETDDPVLAAAVRRSLDDLASLRIFDRAHPQLPVVAAGAPWFMTLFGRDAAISAYSALLVDPRLARGVVEALARLQGRTVDPVRDEEPGKILHELRFDAGTSASFEDADRYYGTIDATPLFVILVAELHRWGLERQAVEHLLPAVDRAMAWIEGYGDRDGDGLLEYERGDERGLANQGWKDSWDGVRYADGRVATAPIALCEVQGYAYAAHLGRADLADAAGDEATAAHHRRRARELKDRFNEAFWLPDRGWYAIGLDADKRPIDSLTSNIGHCLMTGIVDRDKAAVVADHLLGDDLFTGWGVRTLSAAMGGYNPVSYHCGSVWPHDTTIAATGLRRYGFVEEAHRLLRGLLDAAAASGNRLPELFAGVARDQLNVPAAYPTSCVPQAWAAASPIMFLRILLGFDPAIGEGKLWLDPQLPAGTRRLRVAGIPLAGTTVTVDVRDGEVEVDGLPADVELVRAPRPPLEPLDAP